MNLLYVLIPLFKTDSVDQIENQIEKQFHVHTLNNQVKNKFKVHEISHNQYAVELQNFNLHFLQINRIIDEFNEMKMKIDLLESVLKDYEYQSTLHEESVGQSVDALMKKVKKYKQLKQQNKKLKKLLQVQLQNTQKVREQTQKTMKILRQEFDALVTEIGRKQKSSTHQSSIHHTSSGNHTGSNNIHSNNELQTREHKQKVTTQSFGNGKHITTFR